MERDQEHKTSSELSPPVPRWTNLCLLASAVVLGLALRALVDGPLAKYGGVALWSCALYAFVLLARPRLPWMRATLLVVALSFLVELAQLTDGPRYLSSRHVLFRLVLGTTFHSWDLLWYLVGTLVFSSLHARLLRASRRRT